MARRRRAAAVAAERRTTMMAWVAPHRVGGEGDALHDGVRVALHERPVDLGAGVRLEAVGDDVALAGTAGWRSRATCGRCGKPAPPRPRRPDSLDDAR